MSRSFRTPALPLLLFLLCGILGCASTRRGTQTLVFLPTSMEVGIGQGVAQNVTREYPIHKDEGLQRYIQSLGRKVVSVCDRKDLEYHFTVLDSPVPNAFAAPGGYVFITTGLLAAASNEAEVVVVLGHEVGHVVAKHGAQRIQMQFGLGLAAELTGLKKTSRLFQDVVGFGTLLAIQGYGRENELESDWYGALYASRLGYDPKAAISLFKILGALEKKEPGLMEAWLASHPPSAARIKEYERIEPELPSRTGILNREAYQGAVAALKKSAPAR